jgi:UDP-glucose 4-epimerase
MLTHTRSEDTAPARVVILGATGFFASHLVKALSTGGIHHRAVGRSELDLTKPEAAARLAAILEPTDAIAMMSGLTPDRSRGIPALMDNLRMAESVCGALGRAKCGHFVYVSSEAVYDADRIPLDEDSSREPVDLYALTHTAREMMLNSVLTAAGTPYCIVRPTNIYGPGDTHANYGPNRFVRTALGEGRIVLFGRGEERRSHLYINDMIELMVRVIRRQSAGVLNLAMSPSVTFLQAAETVARHCPRPVSLEFKPRTVPPIHRPYKPSQVFRFLSRLGRGISPVVHRPYSVSAIFKAFPDFRYTPFEEGITAYVNAEQSGPNSTGARP